MIRAFFPPNHESYRPWGEFDGFSVESSPEVPERLNIILKAIKRQKSHEIDILTPDHIEKKNITSVHRLDYLDFLKTASEFGKTLEVGIPTVFPVGKQKLNKKLLGFEGLLGSYLFDTSAPIIDSTYSAAVESAACAFSASKQVLKGDLISLALCRPPGHHAGPSYGGGYCFLNNAAIATTNLLSKIERVAILDIDYHHGNGTQEIFYNTNQVLFVSIHGDPKVSFPFYWGFTEEQGAGEGKGFNHNFPLVEATGTKYLRTLKSALEIIRKFNPGALVLSVGLDTYWKDPLGEFKLRQDDYKTIGKEIFRLALPTVVILEGGYEYPDLGTNFLRLIFY